MRSLKNRVITLVVHIACIACCGGWSVQSLASASLAFLASRFFLFFNAAFDKFSSPSAATRAGPLAGAAPGTCLGGLPNPVGHLEVLCVSGIPGDVAQEMGATRVASPLVSLALIPAQAAASTNKQ
jgi:hypothetical protein